MRFRRTTLAGLAAFVLAALARADELGQRLSELTSPRADVRAGAERWLVAHLAPEHYAPLAEAVLGGDAEVRGRIRGILSSDERHLALALALCAEKNPALVGLGRDAVRSGIARFDPVLAETGVRPPKLAPALSQLASDSPPRAWRIDASLSLAVLADQFELVGELPVGLAVDGGVATRTVRRADAPSSGPWDDLLLRVATSLGVSIEAHGLVSARIGGPKSAFLVFTGTPEARTGVEWVGQWLEELATESDPQKCARAARNLAASGFAPALGWMNEISMNGIAANARGPEALEGLIRSAARGRVAPALLAPGVLEGLLAQAEQGNSAPILRGLARIGCLDASGEPLAARLMDGWSAASPGGRWARLFVLTSNRCRDARADEAARALLGERGSPPALRLQALLHLAFRPAVEPADSRWSEALADFPELPLDESQLERLGRALAYLGLAPPYARPEAMPSAWGEAERLRLIELWSWSGKAEVLAAHVAAWLSAGDARVRGELLADRLDGWIAGGKRPLVEEALAQARASAPGATRELERVRLLLGLVPPASVPEIVGAGGYERDGSVDLPVLARLAGYPAELAGERAARAELVRRFEVALAGDRPAAASAELVRAAEHAVRGLFAAGRDRVGSELSLELRRTLRAHPKTELARRLDSTLWPPGPAAEPRDLSRELAHSAVPAGL